MSVFYLYSTPQSAAMSLTLDNTGVVLHGVPCSANGRDDAHRFSLPSDTPSQGVRVQMLADGYIETSGRCLLDMSADPPVLVHDDWHMTPVPPPPDPPPPRDPMLDPFALIESVYAQGEFDLSTKEGCGVYTEACCEALNAQQSALWGHIRKEPAQNQWNGHAIDAVMLLAKAGETDAGIYDIILSTESPDAKPAWSYKGPPDPNLWYYPA